MNLAKTIHRALESLKQVENWGKYLQTLLEKKPFFQEKQTFFHEKKIHFFSVPFPWVGYCDPRGQKSHQPNADGESL